jgi:ZIP family zinc transporter
MIRKRARGGALEAPPRLLLERTSIERRARVMLLTAFGTSGRTDLVMEAFLLSVGAAAITLGGGLLAVRLHQYRAYIFGFCAGALVTAALVEVLPNAHHLLEKSSDGLGLEALLLACTVGYLVFYVLDHVAHGGHVHHGAQHSDTHAAGLWGAIGLALHSFFDGVAIGQGFQAGEEIGWAIAAGVTLHKLADGVSVAGVMLGTQHSVRATRLMVYVVAAAPVLGVVVQSFVTLSPAVLALLLGWFAGIFLYLGASSLLPAAHEASRARVLPFATLAGAVFILLGHLLGH